MTPSQQSTRRTELVAQLSQISSELSSLDALTFQRWAVNLDGSPQTTLVNGVSFDGNNGLAYILRQHGYDDAVDGMYGNRTKAIVSDSEQPPPVIEHYMTVADAEGNSWEATKERIWYPSDE